MSDLKSNGSINVFSNAIRIIRQLYILKLKKKMIGSHCSEATSRMWKCYQSKLCEIKLMEVFICNTQLTSMKKASVIFS